MIVIMKEIGIIEIMIIIQIAKILEEFIIIEIVGMIIEIRGIKIEKEIECMEEEI